MAATRRTIPSKVTQVVDVVGGNEAHGTIIRLAMLRIALAPLSFNRRWLVPPPQLTADFIAQRLPDQTVHAPKRRTYPRRAISAPVAVVPLKQFLIPTGEPFMAMAHNIFCTLNGGRMVVPEVRAEEQGAGCGGSSGPKGEAGSVGRSRADPAVGLAEDSARQAAEEPVGVGRGHRLLAEHEHRCAAQRELPQPPQHQAWAAVRGG